MLLRMMVFLGLVLLAGQSQAYWLVLGGEDPKRPYYGMTTDEFDVIVDTTDRVYPDRYMGLIDRKENEVSLARLQITRIGHRGGLSLGAIDRLYFYGNKRYHRSGERTVSATFSMEAVFPGIRLKSADIGFVRGEGGITQYYEENIRYSLDKKVLHPRHLKVRKKNRAVFSAGKYEQLSRPILGIGRTREDAEKIMNHILLAVEDVLERKSLLYGIKNRVKLDTGDRLIVSIKPDLQDAYEQENLDEESNLGFKIKMSLHDEEIYSGSFLCNPRKMKFKSRDGHTGKANGRGWIDIDHWKVKKLYVNPCFPEFEAMVFTVKGDKPGLIEEKKVLSTNNPKLLKYPFVYELR